MGKRKFDIADWICLGEKTIDPLSLDSATRKAFHAAAKLSWETTVDRGKQFVKRKFSSVRLRSAH